LCSPFDNQLPGPPSRHPGIPGRSCTASGTTLLLPFTTRRPSASNPLKEVAVLGKLSGTEQPLIQSDVLHERLGVKAQHRDWVKRRIKERNFKEERTSFTTQF